MFMVLGGEWQRVEMKLHFTSCDKARMPGLQQRSARRNLLQQFDEVANQTRKQTILDMIALEVKWLKAQRRNELAKKGQVGC